jgi:serine/threonine protein kinase
MDEVFGRYRAESILGRGGMGVVYRAADPTSGAAVAVKVIAPEFAQDDLFRARFEREARLAAQLRHPNIVAVTDSGEQDGHLYLAMPYVDGTDLEAVIAEQGRLHPHHVAHVVAQVASALDAAHALGLVHRDVKPGNVLLEQSNGAARAYLTDFGLSKMTSSQSGLTRTGRWVGTVDYAAPEQLRAEETDARTDVYALGCLTYEALTGDVPFARHREVAKMIAHLTEEPPAVTTARPDLASLSVLDAVVARAMAKQPAERYEDAGGFARALQDAVDGLPPPGEPLVLLPPGEERPVDRGAPTVG